MLQKLVLSISVILDNVQKGALYSALIRMTNSYGVPVENSILLDVQMTNQDSANFSSTTRESVSRSLNELKGMGIPSFEGRKIVIHDLEYLKQEINCENCPVSYCNIEQEKSSYPTVAAFFVALSEGVNFQMGAIRRILKL